ncbi:hypothetical protein BLIC_b02004 [Bifidobacterium longum subsp. infantis]|uniref:Uncharacterized protein n=1 Tax=Bifidobacterium longum subsp. infantis TaxID=1682 RepID=A0ABP1XDQ5_BIFLI|nr:hypothetical protein BLIC_a01993 [Bifidobacterium longum subsp. infantis]CEF03091.1 hypothetical protein BLIC_b02004 [Bifidobacterium longum subsp. infantis]CEF04400.1 hypothetical protein BLIC_c02004 [Bifidobacterium longum subsp. infantis]CEF09184.1 hypothetical protein BLIC_e02017 [Bifidobacterium longum subsp. infantis]CEF11864.1 hypothetical protein BLIC_g01994 [Bifidobacterium longum subsp. infantis]
MAVLFDVICLFALPMAVVLLAMSCFACVRSDFAVANSLFALPIAVVLPAISCLAWDNSLFALSMAVLLSRRSLSSLSRSVWDTALATVIDAPTPQSDLLPE